jgi:diguanylate cyclase (GGDEF)-like protein/PAS domain S-box-containing protein
MPVEETCSEFLARVHPADKNKVEAAIRSTLQKNETVDLIFRANAEDGTLHYIEAHAKAYPGIEGSAPRVIGILKDVTEKYLREESLMLSRVVFDTTAEALVITDALRNIVAVNAAFAKITGYPQAEAQGRNLDELLRIRGSGEGLLHQLAARSQDFWQGEAFCQRKNGESFPSWQSLSAVRNDAGETTHFVTAFSDISPILAAEQQLDHLAHHDPLTGLPNRLLFDDRFEHALSQAERQKQKCLLLFIDLDDFKVVNDTLGHTTGDKLLQVVSSRLSVVLRRSDTIARLGGDEFVVIAEATDSEDGARLAEKILDTLGHPVTLGRERLTISCSIGISVYPDHGHDRHTLMRAADIAMYSAKNRGRNRYQLYSEAMASRASERLQMEQGLRHAIQTDALTLHYQPQVGLADGSLCGIEALVRWPHPELGMIPPARFIPVAEESGVIDTLGRWVLRRACREIRGVLGSDGRQLRLAVNVSARQFLRDDFFESIRDILAETQFPPKFLELEITESCLQDIGRSAALLAKLKALEVNISIDDFGTGYSSLSVLRGLPIDRLKVDRSFIADLHQQADSVNVVHAICTLAKSLGMAIVAEGIELEEQFQIMRGMGCEEGQGFLFSHALPHSELLDLLRQNGASFRRP